MQIKTIATVVMAVVLHAQCFAASPVPWMTDSFTSTEIFKFGFMGHNPDAVIKALGKHPRPQKSEYETQAEYAAKLEKWQATPLFGNTTPGGAFVFTASRLMSSSTGFLEKVDVHYDADSASMSVELEPYCDLSPGVRLDVSLKRTGTYTGSNAFGVHKTVQRYSYGLVCLRPTTNLSIQAQFPVLRKNAMATKEFGRFAFVGHLADDPVEIVRTVESPTVTNPKEIVKTEQVIRLDIDAVYFIGFDTEPAKIWP